MSPTNPMKRRFALGALAALALPGCANYYYGDGLPRLPSLVEPQDLLSLNYQAADRLLAQVFLDPQFPLLVATLVHVDRLQESSRLGRIAAEQIAGRIVQRGLRVTEVKLRESLMLQRDQGVLLLSRELREVSQSQAAQAVLVGTYAPSATQVYISLKLVAPEGNVVMAAQDYALPMDANVRLLLAAR